MWLINTDNFALHYLHEVSDSHPYAILSHTWNESDDDPFHAEVTFDDMRNLDQARKKSGWIKIERTCALARSFEPSLRWVWIDTCCIDKKSSAELAEAINTMFRWYREATVCFTHLYDLPPDPGQVKGDQTSIGHLSEFLPKCRWFTRGWTLQELIAPARVEFYDQSWRKQGEKISLEDLLHEITGVDIAVLRDCENLFKVPVAQKMYWASGRQTKRTEDVAYSLFGIFDVNLPLIYGEGLKAFLRLQDAISQQINDSSLFAWSTNSDGQNDPVQDQVLHGVFARSPRDFQHCKYLTPRNDAQSRVFSYANTNQTIVFQSDLLLDSSDRRGKAYVLDLYCIDTYKNQRMGIWVAKTSTGFVRCRAESLYGLKHSWFQTSQITMPKYITHQQSRQSVLELGHSIQIYLPRSNIVSFDIHDIFGPWSFTEREAGRFLGIYHSWDAPAKRFLTINSPFFIGSLWPNMKSKLHTDFIWPHKLMIVCGLSPTETGKTHDKYGKPFPTTAWAYIIYEDSPLISSANGECLGLFSVYERNFHISKSHEMAASILGLNIRKWLHENHKIPTSVVLYSRQQQATWAGLTHRSDVQAVKLSVQATSKETDDITAHEVVIDITPAGPSAKR